MLVREPAGGTAKTGGSPTDETNLRSDAVAVSGFTVGSEMGVTSGPVRLLGRVPEPESVS